jgi:Domain of unknown function (DUF4287)
MSFQAYLDNIEAKTGIDAAGFRALAQEKGFTDDGKVKPDVKAGTIVDWLKADYDLGHGHAMAVYALLKGKKSEGDT